MFSQLKSALFPFWDVFFFKNYHRLVIDISQRRPSKQFTQIKILLIILSIKSVHFLLLHFLPFSNLSWLLHYDIVTLTFGLIDFNIFIFLMMIGFSCLIFYFYYHAPLANSALLYKIILQGDCSFIIYKFEKTSSNTFFPKQINNRIRCSLVAVYNSFQGFRALFHLFSVFSHILMINKLNELTVDSPYYERFFQFQFRTKWAMCECVFRWPTLWTLLFTFTG